MPSLDSVHTVIPFKPRAAGPEYTIVRTTEVDSYEPSALAVRRVLKGTAVPPRPALVAALKARPRAGDDFAGTDRKAAKLSIPDAQIERFQDLNALIDSLESEEHMIHHTPRITTGATSKRVKEEMRKVGVRGFLYAASREADNDFHLIVGRDPAATPEMYMTMELSGLPPAASAAFDTLKSARDAFQGFFGAQHLPGLGYDFYHPAIPVAIEGALFFDMTHSSGQRPGPPSLKSRMPTIWEVHPVTAITLEP
jgi:hypothetical protein